jgi:pyruvate dehydrogenase E2 component (dihydrolipoamide acetyltransferase)
MATQVLVPVLGEAIGEARIAAWLKRPGDSVRRGEELAELETDKAMLALECPADGVLLEVLAVEGALVTTGQLLAQIGRPDEAAAPRSAVPAAGAELPVVPAATPAATPVATPVAETAAQAEARRATPVAPAASTIETSADSRRRISPAARRMARELGIDVARLTPSEPAGRITTQDVTRLAAPPAGAGRLPGRRLVLTEIQRVMANRMVQSAREIPQFSVTIDVNAAALFKVQQEFVGGSGENGRVAADAPAARVSLTALLVFLVARVLREHPLLNARFDGDGVILYETVNMGVAVTTPQGLVVPVLHGVERLSIGELMRRWTGLVQTARSGRLALGDISDGTFTLSNLGMYGVQGFVPLVNLPQAAILGIGGVQPLVVPDAHGTQHVQRMNLTVSADHRVMDGAAAAAFLRDLKVSIEQAKTA